MNARLVDGDKEAQVTVTLRPPSEVEHEGKRYTYVGTEDGVHVYSANKGVKR